MSDRKQRSHNDTPADPAAPRTEESASADPVEDGGAQQGEATDPTPDQEKDELARLTEALDDARDQVLRTQAEMQNLRRRVERDVESAHKFGLERLIGELLPVVDNLERSVAILASDDAIAPPVTEGVELTLKSFLDVLERQQVEQLDPRGQPFNPEFHQAMSMVPNASVAPNTILEVYQKGYTLNGRLVRPAMVVVAKSEKPQK